MVTKYLDHGLYLAWSATPTFGTCQDGDGTAQGAASVATTAIDLTGFSAAAGNTVTIGGAVLTCVASGAGANQFNAGSGATLAANLATAINQTSNTNTIVTAGASNPMLGWPTNTKIQDMLYATSAGAVLNIQTRMGSAAFNGTSFFAVVSSGLTGGTLSAQFSGGSGGAWGYLFNHLATFGKSNIGVGGYGCWATTRPFAGSMDPGDRIKIRSNKILTLATNISGGCSLAAMGAAAQPVFFEFDDGTIWPADAPNPYFKIVGTWNGNAVFQFSGANASFAHIRAKRYNVANDSLKRSFIMESNAVGTSAAGFSILAGHTPMTWENVLMDAPGNSQTSTAVSMIKYNTGAVAQVRTRFVGCRQVWAKENNTVAGFINGNGANGNGSIAIDSHEFVVNDCTAPISTVLAPMSGGGAMVLKVTDAKFIGFISSCNLLPTSASNPGAGSEITFKNCDFGAIRFRGPQLAIAGVSIMTAENYSAESKYGLRDFFLDRRNGFCEWNSAKGYPTLSAKLLDGVTPWVVFAMPAVGPLAISKVSPFELPAINKVNTLGTGDRTLTMNFAVESTLSWTTGDISFLATYQDSTGAIRYVDTFDPLAATPLTPDTTSTWSVESGGMVSYNGQTFAKKQISIVCPDVAAGCEISIFVRMHTAIPDSSRGVFIDPEFKVT